MLAAMFQSLIVVGVQFVGRNLPLAPMTYRATLRQQVLPDKRKASLCRCPIPRFISNRVVLVDGRLGSLWGQVRILYPAFR